MHFANVCPHSTRNVSKEDVQTTLFAEQITLFTGAQHDEQCVLVTETLKSAILDSGCSSTVTGRIWLQSFIDSLPDSEQEKVCHVPSDAVFRFGGDRLHKSIEKVSLPCHIAGVECVVETDVIECDIPLLLSKAAMKQFGMVLDLVNDTAKINGNEVPLISTSAGHYALPISKTSCSVKIEECMFVDIDRDEKVKVLTKLHKQFAHPTLKRLSDLLKDAGVYDSECAEILLSISEKCEVCLKLHKTPPRPAVALPLATRFN